MEDPGPASSPGTPNRLGFHSSDCKEKPGALFTNRKGRKMEPGTHVVDLYLNLIREIDSTTKVSREFSLAVNAEAQRPVDVFLKAHPGLTSRPIVAVNPGAGFESKQWELSRFAEVADRLAAELELSILLIWGPGEEAKAKEIGSRINAADPNRS